MEQNFLGKLFSGGLKFWSKDQSVVGIDLGTSSIKIVQLKNKKEQAFLETYGELSIGPYAGRLAGQIAQLTEEKITEAISDLFKESGANAKQAVVSIPVRSSFVTTMKLPFGDGKDLGEIIKFEARKYIPVPLNDVDLDWWVLSKDKETDKMSEILLVAIHKEIIQKYKNIIAKAGLIVKNFEIEVFSVWRACMLRQVAPVMIIDLGASCTKMSVLEKGILRVARTIDGGGQLVTDSIAQSLKISFDRAEEIKRKTGLSIQPEDKELVSVMETVLNNLLAEVKQFMLLYHQKYNVSIGRVILSGGGSLLSGIVELAVKNLGVEVVLADPFSKIEHPVFLQETLKEIGPSFAAAAGLALGGL